MADPGPSIATMEAELDFSLDAMELAPAMEAQRSDGWLERRKRGFGCSDLPALLYLLGARNAAPSYLIEKTRRVRTKRGLVPRLFAEKLGLVRETKPGDAAQRGIEREQELIDRWRWKLRNGECSEAETYIRHDTIRHASECPKEWWPKVDREQPALLDTPDGWARSVDDSGLVIQAKCSTSEIFSLPSHWRDQVQGEMAVTGCPWAIVVCGEGWAARWWKEDGPIKTWFVERDEEAIAEIREAVAFGASCLSSLRAA